MPQSLISQVKVLPNPPAGVRLATEAVCVMSAPRTGWRVGERRQRGGRGRGGREGVPGLRLKPACLSRYYASLLLQFAESECLLNFGASFSAVLVAKCKLNQASYISYCCIRIFQSRYFRREGAGIYREAVKPIGLTYRCCRIDEALC